MPTNARIPLRFSYYERSTLRATTGRSVPLDFTLEPAGDELGLVAWLIPSVPVSEEVRIFVSDGLGAGSYEFQSVYEVTPEVDTTPPEVTDVRFEGLGDRDLCSETVGARVVVRYLPGFDAGGVTYEVELFRDGVSLGRTFPWTAFGTSAEPDCLGPGYISGLVAGETLEALVRVWDMGGNYSEHGPFTFTVDHAEPGSARPCAICSAAPGARSSGIWLGTLAVVATVLARRRR